MNLKNTPQYFSRAISQLIASDCSDLDFVLMGMVPYETQLTFTSQTPLYSCNVINGGVPWKGQIGLDRQRTIMKEF